jgi:uncharacterized integral membrane protein
MADRARPASTPGGSWWTSRWAVGGLLAILAIIFIVENREPAAIRLLIPLVVMPQWAALTIAVLLGVLIGVLLRRRRR